MIRWLPLLPALALLACGDPIGAPIERGRHTLDDTHASIGVPSGWQLDPDPIPLSTMRHEGELRMVYLGDIARPRALLTVGRLESTRALDCDEAERLGKRAVEQAIGGDPSIELTCSGPGLGYAVEGVVRHGPRRYRTAARFRRGGRDHLHLAVALSRDGQSSTRRNIALLAGVRFDRASPAPEKATPTRRTRRPPRPRLQRKRRRPRGPQRVPGY